MIVVFDSESVYLANALTQTRDKKMYMFRKTILHITLLDSLYDLSGRGQGKMMEKYMNKTLAFGKRIDMVDVPYVNMQNKYHPGYIHKWNLL